MLRRYVADGTDHDECVERAEHKCRRTECAEWNDLLKSE